VRHPSSTSSFSLFHIDSIAFANLFGMGLESREKLGYSSIRYHLKTMSPNSFSDASDVEDMYVQELREKEKRE
jgi:hypothetical protein